MGMYDHVIVGQEIKCPACGKVVRGWQSKDGDCVMEDLSPSDVCNFYASCACGVWIEFRRRLLPIYHDIIEGFEMDVEPADTEEKPHD